MRVYLDSNIIRHSATRYRTRIEYFGQHWPGAPLVTFGPTEIHIKKPAKNPTLRSEIRKLRELSYRLKIADATLLIDQEALGELNTPGSFNDFFYRSTITFSKRPIPYGEHLVHPKWIAPSPQENFFHHYLSRLDHPRFLHLAKYTGGLQGDHANYNQLADAYFLWCAETNEADFFLTLDMKLKKAIHRSPQANFKPIISLPSDLIDSLIRT